MRKVTSIIILLILSNSCFANNIKKLYVSAENSGLNAHVLTKALNSYNWAKAHGDIHKPNILTVIDYSKPSTTKRLWVLNLETDTVAMSSLVAHGMGSGTQYAKHFSNKFNSHATSLGLFTTGLTPYFGKHGRSLRVHGLEPGINNNAFARDIEIHGAKYASQNFAQKYGRLGRTWGCFGVSLAKAQKLINYTVGGSVIFAYAAPEDNDPVATNSQEKII